MKFRKNYGEFLNEQKVNETHFSDRESQEKYIMQNAHAAGYPDLDNIDVISSMSDVAVEAVYNMLEQILMYNDVREGKVNEAFDFEDYDDTDVNGMTQEIDVDNMIEDHIAFVKRDVEKSEWRNAWSEIKRLWIDKIKKSKI